MAGAVAAAAAPSAGIELNWPMTSFSRNVPLLAVCQALMMSSNSLIGATSALVGLEIASDKSLATLPQALAMVAVMLTTVPAALLMQRIGRKRGFMIATLFGATGSVLATVAIIKAEFWLFVFAVALVGVFNGFGNYYRFTAADVSDDAHKSRAVGYVMAGGIAAAFVGPNVAELTRELVPDAPFAGSYAAQLGFYVLSFVTISFFAFPRKSENSHARSETPARPLKAIARQPKFVVAVICGMLSYAIMSLVMTATPLAMQSHAHLFEDTSFVIQWHLVGMFAPAFVTGHLIKRFGLFYVMLTGVLAGFACVVINLSGTSVGHFWTALVLLGISWSFLFIGASTLLTETYREEERAKTQSANDFMVFSAVAAASLSAGAIQTSFGWQAINICVLPLLIIILISLFWARRQLLW